MPPMADEVTTPPAGGEDTADGEAVGRGGADDGSQESHARVGKSIEQPAGPPLKADPDEPTDAVMKDGQPTGEGARGIEQPLAAFVKDGSPTDASVNLYERRYREAEKRRAEADRDKAIARTPIERGGGVMHSHRFTQHPDLPMASVLLHYVNEYGNKVPPGECCADILIENWNSPNDPTLVIMCPSCWRGGQKHAQDCQLFIRKSNRFWHLIPALGPKQFMFDDGSGPRVYYSAGTIVESEPFRCKDCNWRGRIINNRIRDER